MHHGRPGDRDRLGREIFGDLPVLSIHHKGTVSIGHKGTGLLEGVGVVSTCCGLLPTVDRR